jgi:hypothetical protein
MRRCAWAWFHDVWTCAKACGAKVLEYWMISSLKIKLNHSWKFWRNWIVSLVLLERSWWAGLNEIYLVRVAFRMWEILIFRVISASENSYKIPTDQVLEGKISCERGNTWRLTVQFKHYFLSYSALQKIDTYIAKQCSHVGSSYFVMGSHSGQWHRPH